MDNIETVDTYPKDWFADDLKMLVIEDIEWHEADPNLPGDVRVPISSKTAAFLEDGDDHPEEYEELLMDIRDYIEDCYGYLIKEINGWYIED